MKLLTLNFLTCAVKSCRAAATATTTTTSIPRSNDPNRDPDQEPKGSSFPLHLSEVELTAIELEFNEPFWRNVLSRIEWRAMASVLFEAGLKLPEPFASMATGNDESSQDVEGVEMEGVEAPAAAGETSGQEGQAMQTEGGQLDIGGVKGEDADVDVLKKLHKLLLETQVQEGWLVCGRCGHKYAVKEGIPNFLLPPHLVG
ncbi:MAG: hypothetical protein Q9159_005766 [Coniocarpon cinnabarinum]